MKGNDWQGLDSQITECLLQRREGLITEQEATDFILSKMLPFYDGVGILSRLTLCIKVDDHMFQVKGAGKQEGDYFVLDVDASCDSWCSVRDPGHILTTKPDVEAHNHASFMTYCYGIMEK